MKKRLLSLALCLVLVVGLFSGLTVNASAGKIDDLKDVYKRQGLHDGRLSARRRRGDGKGRSRGGAGYAAL